MVRFLLPLTRSPSSCYALSVDESKAAARAGADVVIAIWVSPPKDPAERKRQRSWKNSGQGLCDAAKSVKPDVITLYRGNPISTPDNTLGANEFYGASSIERLHTEIAIREQIAEFQVIRFQVQGPDPDEPELKIEEGKLNIQSKYSIVTR